MSGLSAVLVLARLEWTGTVRRRWIRLFALAFALLAAGVSWSTGSLDEGAPAEGFARATVAMVPLSLMLVPLAGLLIGISGQGGESGGEGFLFAQPVRRSGVLLGRWLGQAAALAGAVSAGLVAGAAVVWATTGSHALLRCAALVAISSMLAVVFLSLAALIAVASGQRTSALGVGAFAWFFFVILHDSLALWAAGSLSGRLGTRVLFTSVFLNPVDIARVLILSLAGTPHVLGAAGEAWELFLGGAVPAATAAAAALVAWAVVPLLAAQRLIARKDLLA
jgi:Cu-processing system permease protein